MIGPMHDPPQNAAVMLRSLLQHHRLALRALHSGQANPERGAEGNSVASSTRSGAN